MRNETRNPVMPQAGVKVPGSNGGSHRGPGPALMGADTLIGNDVYNHEDENLGDIKEIMLNVSDGSVRYAVLSCGGFVGLGEKLFAVPWRALHLDTANKRFVLDVSKARLEQASGFDTDAWPEMADENLARDGDSRLAGNKPYGSSTG